MRNSSSAVGKIVIATTVGLLMTALGLISTNTPEPEVAVVARGYIPLVAVDRPFPLTYGRKGIAGGEHSTLLDYTVYYNWLADNRWGGNPTKFARMIKCPIEPDPDPAWTALAASDYQNYRGRVWLVGNEPDSIYGECGVELLDGVPVNSAPRQFAHRVVDAVDSVKAKDPSALTFCCGLLAPGMKASKAWWVEFMDELSRMGKRDVLDGVHVHGYPEWVVSCNSPEIDWCWTKTRIALEEWYRDFHVGMGLGNLPIWITEIGCTPFCDDWEGKDASRLCRDNVLVPFTEWFETSDYDAALWFVTYDTPVDWRCSVLEMPPGDRWTLTTVGEEWNAW